jgi:hypothetical protein
VPREHLEHVLLELVDAALQLFLEHRSSSYTLHVVSCHAQSRGGVDP